jgi:small subunit ribosomal protein S1
MAKSNKKEIASHGSADFDWEALSLDGYTQIQRSELSDKYEKTLTSINEKEVIQGTVEMITKKEVIVNIGYKSEGVVAANEFRYNPDLKVGDTVDVYVEVQEDKTGQLIVSHRTARMHSAWIRVNDVLRSGEIITGYVKCRTKGGLIVDVFGIEAFLPGSQIDVKPIRDYDVYVGKNMEFKVVKINEEFRNVVVSHKALIEAEIEEQKKQIISGLEKGQVLEGVVKNITSYGVFIDLGGVDGLIHITDLSWGRVNHPEELLELDQKINVVILDFDDDKKRIALGLKQLQPHPWDSLDVNLNVGDKVSGKVVVMADYGAFIEIAAGVEGLIHVSEMSWSQHLRSAQDFMKIGDTVEAVILTLDRDERKMSLGIKQLMPDPWSEIESKYAVDSKHTAKVRNFTNFGVFVELEEGVDGLIHISDVIVMEIDRENRRISLGHKQLEENPWDVFEGTFAEGSTHSGTITEMKDKSGIVSLPYGVEGICPSKHLRKADGSNAKVEETLDFVVIEFNKDAKKIVLSHTRTFDDTQEAPTPAAKPAKGTKKASTGSNTDEAVKAINKGNEKSTLGDLDALAGLKEKMEKGE